MSLMYTVYDASLMSFMMMYKAAVAWPSELMAPSTPTATWRPCSRQRRTGQTPEPRRRLETSEERLKGMQPPLSINISST